MKLGYGALISPYPVVLSIGTIRKPKLKDIFDSTSGMSFERFSLYEYYCKLTPREFYITINGEDGEKVWDSFSDEKKSQITMWQLLSNDPKLSNSYLEILDYFFEEDVTFAEGVFIILSCPLKDIEDINEITVDMIKGVINEENFDEVMDLIQQVCGIAETKSKEEENAKFKNETAKRIFEKIQKANREQEKKKKSDKNLTIPNLISAIAARHPSLNLINIWELTLPQLLDTFERLQSNAAYEISAARVSSWGDEDKKFDPALWYKNEHDN